MMFVDFTQCLWTLRSVCGHFTTDIMLEIVIISYHPITQGTYHASLLFSAFHQIIDRVIYFSVSVYHVYTVAPSCDELSYLIGRLHLCSVFFCSIV